MPLDTDATLYGYSALTISVLLGLVFVALWLWGKKTVSASTRKGGLILSGLGVVACVIVMSGLTLTGTTSVAPGATYDVTMTAPDSHVTVNNDDLAINVNVDYNYTGSGAFMNNTQYVVVNFTLDRTDRGTTDDTTTAEVTDVGSVADDGEGKSWTLINKGTNYAVNWTKLLDPSAANAQTVTKRGLSTILHIESGGSNWVLCNITLRADALDSMPLYDNEVFYLSIGGIQIAANVRVVNYAGTAPS